MAEQAVDFAKTAIPGRAELSAVARRLPGPGWAYAIVAVQLICQLALLIQFLAPARAVIRTVALGTGLVFLVLIPSRPRPWGIVRILALTCLVLVSLAALNPLGGVPLSVIAHWAMYLAVLSPVFWVQRLNLPRGTLSRVLMILWVFHTVGAVLGILQVYFPGHFQPDLQTIVERRHLLIRVASGAWIPRPTGLTDSPGGAATNGLYAALFGIGIALARPFRFARAAGLLSMMLGLVGVYLSHVRSTLVMLVVCYITIAALFAWSGRLSRAAGVTLVAGALGVIGFYVAFALGGEMMVTRLASLVHADPATVYQNSRGNWLDDALYDQLPLYPLGVGLGHWGMMNAYFGSSEQEIGTEIQIGGWILDGGLPLLLAYSAAVFVTVRKSCRWVRTQDPQLATWACIVGAYGVGGAALCFSYPLFMGTGGVEFWLVNALLAQEAAPNDPR